MNAGTALVRAYLRLNGYLVLEEVPVVAPEPGGGFRTVTDLDLLAVRFPCARQGVPDGDGHIASPIPPDEALRAPAEVVARRRQRLRENARDHGYEASQEYLEMQAWTIFITNCPPQLLGWKEVVVLYRARWQIELLFKLWKSHNRLAERQIDASPERQMAVVYAKLIGVIVQHWLLLTATWNDGRRSLRKAAAMMREWIVLLGEVLDAPRRLRTLLGRLAEALAQAARVTRRRKHPSLFQLLENPELLEYTVR